MHGFIVVLLFATASVACAGCGTNDTQLGRTGEPINGVGCDTIGEERGSCECEEDGRWLCAGQNSVTCSSLFGSGGGRLLVKEPVGCTLVFGYNEVCSDERVYGVRCDGVRCACDVNEKEKSLFFTPRCPDLEEVNRRCGWSLELTGGTGGPPLQGMRCSAPGAHDAATGCDCLDSGWDCPGSSGCRLGGTFDGSSHGALGFSADGTFTRGGIFGTWQLEGQTLFVRSLHTAEQVGCEQPTSPFGGPTPPSGEAQAPPQYVLGSYEVSFQNACSTLELALISDACGARRSALAGFSGVR